MDSIFSWHITGNVGFGLKGAWLTLLCALFNSIGLAIYTVPAYNRGRTVVRRAS